MVFTLSDANILGRRNVLHDLFVVSSNFVSRQIEVVVVCTLLHLDYCSAQSDCNSEQKLSMLVYTNDDECAEPLNYRQRVSWC